MSMLQQMERLGIAVNHGNHVCDIRELIDKHNNMQVRCKTASDMLMQVAGVDMSFDDDNVAIATTQYMFDSIVHHPGWFDVDELAERSRLKAVALVTNPKNRWMFRKSEVDIEGSGMKTEVQGVDIQVEVKADGKIKKGGKSILAIGLMNRYLDQCVAEGKPYIPKEMKAILVKDCQMSDLGSGTYEYGLRVTQKLIDTYQTDKGVTIAVQMKGKK